MTLRYVLSTLSLATLFGCAAPPVVDKCKVIVKDGNIPSTIPGKSGMANAGAVGMTVTKKSSDPACNKQ